MNSSKSRQSKIDFIKSIPGYEKINAKLDFKAVEEIMKKMIHAGLYKERLHTYTALENMIMEAQGKRLKKNYISAKTSPTGEKRFYDDSIEVHVEAKR